MNRIEIFIIIAFFVFLSPKTIWGQKNDDCEKTIFDSWVRKGTDGQTTYWDFLRRKEGLVADYTQGVLIKSNIDGTTHSLKDSFRFFTPTDDRIFMTVSGDEIDTFSMVLKCDMVLLKKINKNSSSNDTIHLYRAEKYAYKFDKLQIYCPPKPEFSGLSDFYFNFFTYLKTIRIKYYFPILTIASILILIRYFLKFRFLLSILQFNTIITAIWLGLLYGGSFQLRPQYNVMYVCDVDASYFPKFTYYNFSNSSLDNIAPILKDSQEFWLQSFKTIFITCLVFSIWIAWRKHYGKFNFGKIKVVSTIADIFLQFSVPLVIILLSSGYALAILIGTFSIFSSTNFIVFGVSAIIAWVYCKKILYEKYFYFDTGEQKTFREYVEEKIKELFS